MNCNLFKKRLYDFLEDNLSYDLRKAMLEHLKDCEACNALYKEELEVDETLKAGLIVDTQGFRSSRNHILDNIDKNRYGVSPIKRFIKHFKNYIGTYTSLVAVIVVFAFLIPYVRTHEFLGVRKTANSPTAQSSKSSLAQDNSVTDKSVGIKDETSLGIVNSGNAIKPEMKALNDINYLPQFEKKLLDKATNVVFNTPWQTSLNKKYSATVEGKGTFAQEEGIGTIILKDLNNGQQWSFSLVNNNIKQFSPKLLRFVDDENLLVIVGLGYGMVHQGGNLYLLNINTGLTAKADPQNTANLDDKSEITKIQSVNMQDANILTIGVETLVYEDEDLNKNHRENRTITSPFSEIIKNIKE